MSDSLGLSIGMTNLVAARVGRPPVMRRAVLTLFSDRAPEVGMSRREPCAQSARCGADRLRRARRRPGPSGRRGRQRPPRRTRARRSPRRDGPHGGRRLTRRDRGARALGTRDGRGIARSPARQAEPGARRRACRARTGFRRRADRAAGRARTADGGVVALVDLGGSGTSITLADANANLAPIGETVRYADFSGDQIDQAVLNHVIAGIADANNADPAGTAAVGSLTRLRDESRQAKERLSAETATVVPVDLPGFQSDVRLTRTELENLIAGPLAGLLAAIEETLERNNIAPAEPCRGGYRRWRRGHPAGHPAAVRAIPRPGHHHAAVAAERGGGRGAARRPGPGRRRAHRAVGRGGHPDGYRAGGMGGGCRRARRRRVGSRRRPVGDVPRTGVVAGRRAAGGEPVPYTGADYSADVYSGPTDARPPVAFRPGRRTGLRGRAGTAALVQAPTDPVRRGGSRRAARDRRAWRSR